ncbi:MAG: HAD family hydrolase [Gammaproteobacteria bacterium]|nr:HAD family hydrolase [Gammaproteobacteria bacterium]|tara:strand:- start:1181 stop:1828 length:648 start_codon:yes stop_codon:yes gene_type:complete
MFTAVLWDFGGVFTTSPFENFSRYEAARGLPKDFIRGVNSTNPDTNAWAQLEASEISRDTFDGLFATESRALGHEIRGADVLDLLSGELRPAMVHALDRIRAEFKTACLTNNIRDAGEGPGMAKDRERAAEISEVFDRFDAVIESSVVGIRKPNPEFYKLACKTLGVTPDQSVFLDDLGINLKPARALGMSTIKVLNQDQALDDLSTLLDMDLRA